MVALKDNKTLHITKDKKYEVFTFMEVSLVVVVNDIGDRVIMSKYDFKIDESY